MSMDMRNQMPRVIAGLAGLMVGAASLASAPEGFKLAGIVRDFRADNRDFNLSDADDFGTVLGLVGSNLDQNGRPELAGNGRIVTASAVDAAGRPLMALSMPATGGEVVTDFDIDGGHLVPDEVFAVELKVIGAAIENGTYHLPVTAQIQIGNDTIEPFGPYMLPVAGNLNDNQDVTGRANVSSDRRTFRSTRTYPAGTAIGVTGRSWTRNRGANGLIDSHWSENYTVTSNSASTRMQVLRNGDKMPNYDPAYDQDSIEVYLADYVDDSGRIELADHQVIYLFELGTSSGGDFQDLVVLASLVPHPSDFGDEPPAPAPGCIAAGGSQAVLGSTSDAGIHNSDSFQQWFTDVPGVNMATTHTIEFTKVGDVYVHTSADFAPIDASLFGNESASHNRNLTFSFGAEFECVACSGQFFEFNGAGDVWAFVDGKLAMDLGGMTTGARQVIDMDRLGLDPAVPHSIQFFYAQRADMEAPFSIRTNIVLNGQRGASLPGASIMAD